MWLIDGVKAGTEQILLGLTTSTPHGLDSIQINC